MAIVISGQDWNTADEIYRNAYQRVWDELKKGTIKFGEQFTYPALAKAMRDNHYYLSERKLEPDYFIIEKVAGGWNGLKLSAYIPGLPSENKFREIEIQRKITKRFQKDLLIRAMDEFFEQQKQDWIRNAPACERCQKPNNGRSFRVYLPAFEFSKAVPAFLDQYPWGALENAFAYDFGLSEVVKLKTESKMIVAFGGELKNVQRKVLCPACYAKVENDYMWDRLLNGVTPEKEIRGILRNLVKSERETEINRFLKEIQPALTPRLRQIPANIRKLLPHIQYVAKDLYTYPGYPEFFKQWADLLTHVELLDTAIGQGIAEAIYRINDGPMSAQLFIHLFRPRVNLFRFFRTVSQYPLNDALFPFLTAFTGSENEPMLKAVLQGVVHANNPPYLHALMANFAKFSPPLQETIIVECFALNNPKTYDLLDSTVQPPAAGSTAAQSTINAEIQDFFIQKAQIFNRNQALLKAEADTDKAKMKEEERDSSHLFETWREKTGPSPYPMEEVAKDLINNKYRPIIQDHINKYKDEFKRYFEKYSDSLIAFDVEEWNFQMFCILAIEIKPDLRVFVKLMAVDDIYPLRKYTYLLEPRFRAWLKTLDSPQVISHGSNEGELALIKESGHTQVNTQDILHNARFYSAEYSKQIQGEGLKHFEDFLDFKRKGCGMLKHEIRIQTFFEEALVSLDRHLTKTAQRECKICGKEQDVLLYCLEDALSCMLIYVYFANHEPVLL